MLRFEGSHVARVKDILDDEEWKIKPVSLLLCMVASTLGVMIIYNALAHQHGRVMIAAATPASASSVSSPLPLSQPATIVLKYDPVIEDMQRELLAAGIYKGTIDGVNGARTKQSVQAYQQMNGMAPTGEATQELVSHIKFARKVQAAAQFTGSTAPTLAPAVAPISTAAPLVVAAKPDGEMLNLKKVQVALAGLGYDVNKLDGQLNDETHSAILKYQMDNGLDMSGNADTGLLSALKISGK